VIPMMTIFFLALTMLAYLLFNATAMGFYMRAVGGNKVAARSAEVPHRRGGLPGSGLGTVLENEGAGSRQASG